MSGKSENPMEKIPQQNVLWLRFPSIAPEVTATVTTLFIIEMCEALKWEICTFSYFFYSEKTSIKSFSERLVEGIDSDSALQIPCCCPTRLINAAVQVVPRHMEWQKQDL
jgi:hypothetical protein